MSSDSSVWWDIGDNLFNSLKIITMKCDFVLSGEFSLCGFSEADHCYLCLVVFFFWNMEAVE